jgi:hypothetical protein
LEERAYQSLVSVVGIAVSLRAFALPPVFESRTISTPG